MLEGKKVSLEDLECVSGGTIIESYHVGCILQDAGYKVFDSNGYTLNFDKFRSVLKGMGFEKINDHGGILNENSYVLKGETMNNEQLINFLVQKKGCKDLGVQVYGKRLLENFVKS